MYNTSYYAELRIEVDNRTNINTCVADIMKAIMVLMK